MGGPGGRAECGGDGEGMAEEAWRQADNGAIGAVGGAGCERGAWACRRGWRVTHLVTRTQKQRYIQEFAYKERERERERGSSQGEGQRDSDRRMMPDSDAM